MKKIIFFIFYFIYPFAYAQDGLLDSSFGIEGKVTTDFANSSDAGYSVAVQADGKIVVAGYSAGNYPNIRLALVRYNSDGTLDNSFDGDGRITMNFDGFYDQGRSVAIQSDGKILVAGLTIIGNNVKYNFALARYNQDGILDSTFDSDGKVTTDVDHSSAGFSVALQNDGKIVVVGSSSSGKSDDFTTIRYNSDGTLDSTFSVDGKVTTNIGNLNVYGAKVYNYANSVAIQKDGKIVVTGYSENGEYADEGDKCNSDITLVRYESNGDLDNTFGSGGIINTEFDNYYEKGNSVVMQNDGKIVVAGMSYNGTVYEFALLRYNSNGMLDSTFDSDGMVTGAIAGSSKGYSVALQNDGRIVVAGYGLNGANYDFALLRYNSNGTLDSSFGTYGKTATDFGNNNDFAVAIAIQQDSKIVLAGYSWNGSDYDFAVARYNNTATLGIEETMSNGITIFPNPSSGVFAVQMHNCRVAGKIIVHNILGDCLLERYCRGETSQQIDLSCQPKGIYFVELLSGNERVVKKVAVH